MPESTDVSLVPESNNQFVQGINDFFGTLTAFGQGAANVYSTFAGAQATAALAKTQKVAAPSQPTSSDLVAISAAKTKAAVTYAGIAIAVIGTLFLAYKAIK